MKHRQRKTEEERGRDSQRKNAQIVLPIHYRNEDRAQSQAALLSLPLLYPQAT